ncbi:hypothetical protein L1987_67765 [Smallanthus sonchifolius]|uniref:Uncharacterized protein n=1 Tax=Smallanthus sonchifolius TaxID=185202 RepID=A0ACB9B2W5_9ASTR|nr:hypothetical protein L1987_67765 [Smallanthus sonchifolius]
MAFKVEITATHVVKPSRPTPDYLKTHNLSLFDQLAPSIYPPIIFFYKAKPDSNLTPLLKTSLSRVLSSFYPYAGRVNGDVFIDCNDAGIPYFEAVVDCSLSDVLKEDLSLMSQFVPLTEESVILDHTIPLLVQVSLFKCGGIAIGACSSHKIGDASNFFMFIREWANVSLADNPVLIPEFSISSRFPQLGFLNFDTGIKIQLNEKLVRKRFVLGESSILSLKAQATPCTRVQAVTALIWKCTMNAVKKSTKPNITSSIAMTLVNMRGRFNPPLPPTSFGNFVGSFLAEKTFNDENEIELHGLVDQLRHRFKDFCDVYMKEVQDSKDGIFAILNYSKKIGEMLQRNGIEVFTFSSWCGFPLYDIDFGWGKPRWISVTNTPFRNGIMMMDTKEGNGIEVWVNLEEDVMAIFEQDHDLLAYCSPGTCDNGN